MRSSPIAKVEPRADNVVKGKVIKMVVLVSICGCFAVGLFAFVGFRLAIALRSRRVERRSMIPGV